MTRDIPVSPQVPRMLWQAVVRHAPGCIVGLHFLALHFVATLDLSFLVLWAGAIFLLLTQPELAWRRLSSAPTLLACALFVSTLLSIHMATIPGDANLGVSQLPGLLLYAIVVLCVRDPRQLAGIVVAFAIALAAMLWNFAEASLHSEFSRAVQLIYHGAQPLFLAANDMLMYVVFMPLVVWFALREVGGRGGRALAVIYVLLVGLLAVLLLSRLSMLLVAAFCFFYFNRGRGRRFWLAATVVAAALLAAFLFDASFAEKLRTLDLARLRTWIVALAMAADAPWFGNGPGSFTVLYPTYLEQMPESIRFGREIRDIGWAHSLFFEAAAEKGVLGLAVAVAYFVYLFATLRRRLRDGGGELSRALRATVAICLVAAVFEMSLLRAWGVYALYLLLALVAAFEARPARD